MAENTTRKTIICVDFGMTGSAVVWRTSQWNSAWSTIGKIPTVLAYDPLVNQGLPIAWGQGCRNLGADQVKQCFKAFFGDPASIRTAKMNLWAPSSPLELRRWIRDYLRALCRNAADTISEKLGPDWTPSVVIWNFSVPGRWSEYPVVANFKQLAEEALNSCLLGQTNRVEVLATEAEASAQSILNQGQLGADNERHAMGNVVISCDIGGATTDVAISDIVAAGKLASWSRLISEPRGVVAFEQIFWEHAEQVLRSAGAQEPCQWALEITKCMDLVKARNEFSKSYGDVVIRLPSACGIENWRPPARPGTGRDTTIWHYALVVPSIVFEELLAEFIEGIQEAIDEAVNVLDKLGNRPALIGLCGGGSHMLYLQARLKARYEPSIPVACPKHLLFPPELATGHGLSLVYDKKEMSQFVSGTSFGIETPQGTIEWMNPKESSVPHSAFKQNSWVCKFACKSRDQTAKHKIVVVPAASHRQRTFKDAYQSLQSRTWAVEVDLYHDDRFLPRSVKYSIACSFSRPNEIEFEAQLSIDGRQLSCRSTVL